MKLKYEILAAVVSWFLVTIGLEKLGVTDWGFWSFMIVFAFVYIPMLGIIRWVMLCKFTVSN